MTCNTPKVLFAVNPARSKSNKKSPMHKIKRACVARVQHRGIISSTNLGKHHHFRPICLVKHTFLSVFFLHKGPDGTIWWKQLQLLTELVSVWATLTSAAGEEYQRLFCLHHLRLTGEPTEFSAKGNRFELVAPQQPPPSMAFAALHDEAVFCFF